MNLLSDTFKTWIKGHEARIWQNERVERGETAHVLAYTVKLGEEVGELAEQVLARFGYQRKSKKMVANDDTLADECADVIIVALFLAHTMGIDIEKALERKIKKLNERQDAE